MEKKVWNVNSLTESFFAMSTELSMRTYEPNWQGKTAGFPLTGIQAYYTPENLAKMPKIRWAGVWVCPK